MSVAPYISKSDVKKLFSYLKGTRYPERNTLIFSLSFYVGLRVGEISKVKWGMLLGKDGSVRDTVFIRKEITKGCKSDRKIPAANELKKSITNYKKKVFVSGTVSQHALRSFVVVNERGQPFSPNSLAIVMAKHFKKSGVDGTSHSGRRTFGTNAAREANRHDGCIEDVRHMLGHSSIAITQRYLETNPVAQKKIVNNLY
jgi:integrase